MGNIVVITNNKEIGTSLAQTFESPKVAALELKCNMLEQALKRKQEAMQKYYNWNLALLNCEMKEAKMNAFEKIWAVVAGSLWAMFGRG